MLTATVALAYMRPIYSQLKISGCVPLGGVLNFYFGRGVQPAKGQKWGLVKLIWRLAELTFCKLYCLQNSILAQMRLSELEFLANF